MYDAAIARIYLECAAFGQPVSLTTFHGSTQCSLVQRGERNCQSIVNCNSRTVGGLKDPNALSRPDQVGTIENVQKSYPVSHFADGGHVEASLSGKVDLYHVRLRFQIGEPPAQSAAIENISEIGRASC